MIDEREALERAARRSSPEAGIVERVYRRRDRKRRNQRIVAAAVAVIVAVAAVSTAVAAFGGRHRVPADQTITPTNVADLRLAWSATLHGRIPADGFPYAPTLAGDHLYVGTTTGAVYSLPTSCGTDAADCTPTWSGQVDGPVRHAPSVADGDVFVDTDDGRLYEFPASCVGTCEPIASADIGNGFYSSPVVTHGLVYGIDVWNGVLYAVDESCGACASGTLHTAWKASLGSRLRDNLDCGDLSTCVVVTPTVVGGTVYASAGTGSGTLLMAFDARTGRVRWKSEATDFSVGRFRSPVVDGDQVFVSNAFSVYAFPTGCSTGGATCAPRWIGHVGNGAFAGQPLGVGGSVIVGTCDSGACSSGSLYGFPERCGHAGGTCWSAWRAEAPMGLIQYPLTVDSGLAITSGDGAVAFDRLAPPIRARRAGRARRPHPG
jgi:outer membrane protein assembly factor BamB